ncbi:MAG: hypothetical protein GWP75_00350 [Planctomycetia bacterium]|nr:hypothetical protein [Planctomycetia bacterium]
MNTSTTNKIALATLVAVATATTARADQGSRNDANSVGTSQTVRDAGTYSPGKTTPRYTPTVDTNADSVSSARGSNNERKKGSKGRNANPLPSAGTQAAASASGPEPRPILCTDRCGYVEIPGILYDPMDMNLDGTVDDTDFLWLCKAYGTEEGDLNEDGITDGLDLGLMLVRLANEAQIQD